MAGTTGVETLEVGGVDLGPAAANFTDNFALNSLTLFTGSTVELVDNYQNATASGWTAGTEAPLSVLAEHGWPGDPILDLNGLHVYIWNANDPTHPIELGDGLYNGITVEGAPPTAGPVPEPATIIIWSLLGAVSWLGMRVARRRGPIGRKPWSSESRQAIHQIISR